jgi:hypothetical protein
MTLQQKLLNPILKLLFGLESSQGMEPKTGVVQFQMQRSPRGKLRILYLDEELRIIKGSRGTVLVFERL